ncbi:MAG TPA: phosphatidylinositol-specific phospholipase C domain-containing protein [Caulobacter sp.]|nr:phosphatidylinositol-specific phospholipase C domain-containing protein [Caulobacter sp.]
MSKGYRLQIFNLTPYAVNLKTTLVDVNNWESPTANNPLYFNGVGPLAANSSTIAHHEEINNGQDVAEFYLEFSIVGQGSVTSLVDAEAVVRSGEGQGYRKGYLSTFEDGTTRRFRVLEAQYDALPGDSYRNLAVVLMPKADPLTWMSKLRGDALLRDLTIPGTHDTGASINIIEGSRCQDLSIADQLAGGVRFLDLRLDPAYPLQIIHGMSNTKKYFRNDCAVPIAEFLKYKGPDETIVLCVGQEGGPHFHQAVIQILQSTLNGYFGPKGADEHLFTGAVPGNLDSLRGKVVLLRRYDIDQESINAGFDQPMVQLQQFQNQSGTAHYGWPKNSDTFEETGDNGVFYQPQTGEAFAIQDYFSLPLADWRRKAILIENYMGVASQFWAGTWFFNFLSATQDIVTQTPRAFAEGYQRINATIYTYLVRGGAGRYGTLPTDFVHQPEGLVELMINSNQRLVKP